MENPYEKKEAGTGGRVPMRDKLKMDGMVVLQIVSTTKSKDADT